MEGKFGWGREEGGWRKGPWTSEEDVLLVEYVRQHGEGRWNSVSKLTGLTRSGKSCRLRWVNYLRPDLKRGKITPQEESVILELHALWGNRWSTIARSLPGRTDNEIKNYWRTHFKKGKPSKNIERARARFLKQRREMQQNQLLGQQPQQHHQDLDQDRCSEDVINMSSHVEATLVQEDLMLDVQEYMEDLMYQPMSHLLHGGGASCASTSEGSTEDDGSATWGSLWNLDDVDGGACCGGFPNFLQDQELAFY